MRYTQSQPELRNPKRINLKRYTNRQILAAAKRFAKAGEIKNAVNLINLVYPDVKFIMQMSAYDSWKCIPAKRRKAQPYKRR